MSAYRFPNLLLVGAQKCGTTHIHEVLSHSPEIVASQPKELNFFNRRDHTQAAEIANYQAQFAVGPQKYYLESTPHYFRLPIKAKDYDGPVTKDVASAIASMLPSDRRLLVILRNPIERAVSANIHHIAQGRLPYRPVLKSVEHQFGIVARGYFGQILAHWRSIFGAELKVLMFDELEADPEKFYLELISTLNLNPGFLDKLELSKASNSATNRVQMGRLPKKPDVSPDYISELLETYRDDILYLFEQEEVFCASWLDEDALMAKLCSNY